MHYDCRGDHLNSTAVFSRSRKPEELNRSIDISFITIQILNWDGLHLLKESLPAVYEAVRRHSDRTRGKT
jgi:hypothetical protein